jgi:hypothetical protein
MTLLSELLHSYHTQVMRQTQQLDYILIEFDEILTFFLILSLLCTMQKFSQQQTIIPPTPDEDLQLLINQYCLVRESSPLYTQSKPYHQYCL